MMNKDVLKNQIWITRISRVNAEKRLLRKEKFIQLMNIYYSCIIIILSIISLVYSDNKLSMLSLIMSISLTLSILYLNSQKYADSAASFRDNYVHLQRLEYELNHIEESDIASMKEIEGKYCDLLNVCNNHITYDYLITLRFSHDDFKNDRWNESLKHKFYWEYWWRKIIYLIWFLLPIITLKILYWNE